MGRFTREDVNNLQNFAKFVSENGKFNVDWADAIQLAKYSGFVSEIIKKISDHIIELEKVTEAPAPKKGKK